ALPILNIGLATNVGSLDRNVGLRFFQAQVLCASREASREAPEEDDCEACTLVKMEEEVREDVSDVQPPDASSLLLALAATGFAFYAWYPNLVMGEDSVLFHDAICTCAR